MFRLEEFEFLAYRRQHEAAIPHLIALLRGINQSRGTMGAGHSIYRTHSLSMEGMRSRFRIIGLGYAASVDAVGQGVFDEFRFLDRTAGIWRNLEQIRDVASEVRAQILFMPSVGMSTLTVFLTNLRVVPFTVVGLGHPATTHSPLVDLVVVEDDFVGEEYCFSERLMRLPIDALPHRPPPAWQQFGPIMPGPRRSDNVQIAVVATSMKINPRFLLACARIIKQSAAPVRMHFLVANAVGLVAVPVKRLIERFLGDSAIFHQAHPYPEYLRIVASCDLFLNPFPFGNTNGIVDTVYARAPPCGQPRSGSSRAGS